MEHKGYQRSVSEDGVSIVLPTTGTETEMVLDPEGKVWMRTTYPRRENGIGLSTFLPFYWGDVGETEDFFRNVGGFEPDEWERLLATPEITRGLRPATTLRCERLRLTNFCGFDKVELEPGSGNICAIIGNNGAGKTSILDALAIALSWLARRVENRKSSGRRPSKSQIRNGAQYCEIEVDTSFYEESRRWTVVEKSKASQSEATSYFGELHSIVRTLQWEYNSHEVPINLPLLVYYPVNRAVLDVPKRIKKRHDFGPLETYEDALSAGSRDFRIFFEWFRERENIENEIFRDAAYALPDPQLRAVREAIRVFTGLEDIRIRRRPTQRMVVKKGAEELDVEQLSDGEKCLLALVGDLARRLALANPGANDPLRGSGVVLIDELELHLHPLWQRQVLENLEATFPNCQFFVTTHSPLVLSQLPKESVRIVENFKILKSEAYVEGREANSIMAELMGVPVFPDSTAESIAEIEQLAEAEEYEKARAKLDRLAEKLGQNDPEVVHQRNAIEFLAEGVFDIE